MLETKNPPGCLRIEVSFFSAAFENPSIVSEYMACALLGYSRKEPQASCQPPVFWLCDGSIRRSVDLRMMRGAALMHCRSAASDALAPFREPIPWRVAFGHARISFSAVPTGGRHAAGSRSVRQSRRERVARARPPRRRALIFQEYGGRQRGRRERFPLHPALGTRESLRERGGRQGG